MDKPLGPMQGAYDTWCEVHDQVVEKPLAHFPFVIGTQVAEVMEALAQGNQAHAAEEMVDIISVTLNWLRWAGLNDEQMAEVMRNRTSKRYAGQAQAILDKYHKLYGV